MSVENLLASYKIAARAAGLSERTIQRMDFALRLFSDCLGGIPNVTKVTADDLRRFVILCQSRPTWYKGSNIKTRRKLSMESVRAYARSIKTFWSWLERQGIIKSAKGCTTTETTSEATKDPVGRRGQSDINYY